jgi:biotin transport system substrate-specific component
MVTGRRLNAVIGVSFFVLATALGAYVRIPVPGTPVPITLQTFFVIMAGAVLGRRLGALSQAFYLILGAAGVPVFQGAASGVQYLAGPTGGYIFGFVIAAYAAGYLSAGIRPSKASAIASFTLGIIIIYACGVSHLAMFYGMSLKDAVSIGALPFIPADALKILLAAAVYSGISGRARQIFPA